MGSEQSGGDVVKERVVMLFSLVTVILVTFWSRGEMITEFHHCVFVCVKEELCDSSAFALTTDLACFLRFFLRRCFFSCEIPG